MSMLVLYSAEMLYIIYCMYTRIRTTSNEQRAAQILSITEPSAPPIQSGAAGVGRNSNPCHARIVRLNILSGRTDEFPPMTQTSNLETQNIKQERTVTPFSGGERHHHLKMESSSYYNTTFMSNMCRSSPCTRLRLAVIVLLGSAFLSRHVVAETKSPTTNHTQPHTECLAANEEFSTFHCLLLKEPLRVPCIDAEPNDCPRWAQQGECSKNPQYMLLECRQSCHSCIELHQGGVLQIAPYEDTRRQILNKLMDTQAYQHKAAQRSVASLQTCVNKHELCTLWSILGECDVNPHYMQHECSAACQTCSV